MVRRAVAEHSVSGKSGYNQTLETASALQALADILPVHQIPPRLDVVSLDVQVIQVEGMFPHVQHEQRDRRNGHILMLIKQLETSPGAPQLCPMRALPSRNPADRSQLR